MSNKDEKADFSKNRLT